MLELGGEAAARGGIPWQTTSFRLVHTAAGKPWYPSWLGLAPRRAVSSRTQASMSAVVMPGAIRAATYASVSAAAFPARRSAAWSFGSNSSMVATGRAWPSSGAGVQYRFGMPRPASAGGRAW